MGIVTWVLAGPLLAWLNRRGRPERLSALEGRTLAVGPPHGAPLKFRVEKGRVRAAPLHARADMTVRARPSTYLAILRGRLDPDAAFFQRRIELDGSLRVALVAKNVFDGLLA